MNLIQITPGAGGMYCGNCFRDNALVAALRRLGHDTLMVPLYLPMTLDETSTVAETPTFFGGINVFLDQKSAFYRGAPSWLRQLLDSPALLKWAAGKTAKTRPDDVGELTVSMLKGEHGNQARDLEEMVTWLRHLPGIDAVFLSNALLAGFARRLKQELGCKVICFLQSEESFLDSLPDPWKAQAWAALAAEAVEMDAWISPSRYFADRMTARLGLRPERLLVIPNGISLEGYDTLPDRETKRPGELLTLGYFARMCPEKGLDTVVEAFIRLRRKGLVPNLRLKVGGGCGPSDEKFVAVQKQKLAAAGLLDHASFHPNVSREEKVAFYAGCDVLSVPAKLSESFGLYLIESLAAGTPLVQPSAITYPEVLAATGGGVLCGANTAEALATALEPLLLEPARLRELGDAGRDTIFARYTDEVMAREIARVTGELLGAPRGAAAAPPAAVTS
ncbi:MAG TPA: glycosyltransferase family 4 protein [Candidatus Limnocylindria bacterium]|nr:glycosyltransferase family 4 protein [Candidatus Limnocylindria bacterium]